MVYRGDSAHLPDTALLPGWESTRKTTVWVRDANGWSRLDPGEGADALQVAVVVERFSPPGGVEPGWPEDLPGELPAAVDPASVDIVRARAITGLAERIADGSFRPKGLGRMRVQVLRGNAPLRDWGIGDVP